MSTMSRVAMFAAAVALLLPAITRADTVVAESNPCVRALMESLAETHHPAPKLRSASLADSGGGSISESGPAEWILTATNPRTNLPVARVSCVTNNAGKVVEFRQEPLY